MPAVSMACGKGRHYDCKGLADTVSPYALPCGCSCHKREEMIMEKTRCPLGRAEEVANEVVKLLEPGCERIAIAGSIRRRKSEVGDIEILVIPKYGGLGCAVNLLDQQLIGLRHEGVLNYRLNKRGSRAYGPKNKLMVHVPSGIGVDVLAQVRLVGRWPWWSGPAALKPTGVSPWRR